MPSFIKIEDVRDVPSAVPGRNGKTDKQVIYLVDMTRRYFFMMAAEDYTADKAMEKIKADETERQKLIGHQFTV
jgi:hypothetical protein